MASPTLPQPWRKLLLTVHIAATVGAFGADLVLLVLAGAGLAGAEPVTVYPAAARIGASLMAPLALASLATGVALGLLTPWGLVKHWWVALKLAIVTVLAVALFSSLLPALDAAADAVAGPSPRALTTGDRVPLVIAPAVAATLLGTAIVLAIFKPGGRLRSRASRDAPLGARHSP